MPESWVRSASRPYHGPFESLSSSGIRGLLPKGRGLPFLQQSDLFHVEQKLDQAVRPQQDLNFLPEPQGQGSLRPTLGSSRLRGSSNFGAGGWSGVLAGD
jgi:hypothetical protein